ncbi:MAG TPA: hypothetical protein PKM79_09150 [Smithellaceae bacterium]|nr:hypothetical protein [Smithellaceae bacterium]HQM44036.1 hypothetical protein [Smithellaceae bacterium]
MTNPHEEKILDDKQGSVPERELWSAVILQALVNIHFQNKGWHDDLGFIAGGGNWNWICEQLGMDARRVSRLALAASFDLDDFKKH